MNRNEAKANGEALLAFAEGKPLQFRRRGSGDKWYNASGAPLFAFSEWEYRAKPEPEELYITVRGDLRAALSAGTTDRGGNFIGGVYAHGAAAQWFARDFPQSKRRVFKLVEVLPE